MSVSLVRPVPAQRDGTSAPDVYLQKDGFSDLHVFCRRSLDEGKTFEPAVRVTTEAGYHVMNNDRVVRLATGRLLCPIASTSDVVKVNHFISYCVFSDDNGRTWRRGKGSVDQPKRGAMEPEVIEMRRFPRDDARPHPVGLHRRGTSSDGGDSWSVAETWGVQAPEAPASLRRIPSTGDWLLIWNNTYDAAAGHGGKRTPLSAPCPPTKDARGRHRLMLKIAPTNRTPIRA